MFLLWPTVIPQTQHFSRMLRQRINYINIESQFCPSPICRQLGPARQDMHMPPEIFARLLLKPERSRMNYYVEVGNPPIEKERREYSQYRPDYPPAVLTACLQDIRNIFL